MRNKCWVTVMAGWGLAMVALLAHGQDAVKAAPEPPLSPRASSAETITPPQSLFIVHLTTGPAWIKSKPAQEQAGFKAHSQNLSRLRTGGLLVMGARQDRAADKGMLIMRADNIEAVNAQFAADPMVKEKLFVLDIAEFQPFYDGFIAQAVRPAGTVVAPDSPLNALTWLAGCWFTGCLARSPMGWGMCLWLRMGRGCR